MSGDFRSQPETDYADLVKQLHDHAQYFAAGHGPLHAAAANAIDHLMTLNRLMAHGIGRCDAETSEALIKSAPDTLKQLGSRLADLLDADDWNNIEPLLYEICRALSECKAAALFSTDRGTP